MLSHQALRLYFTVGLFVLLLHKHLILFIFILIDVIGKIKMINYLTERHIEILYILINEELEDKDTIFTYQELHQLKDAIRKIDKELEQQKETSQASLATRIDNQIYKIIKSEFSNCHLIVPTLTVEKMIQGYERWGQHKLDFNCIYDLD